MYEYGGTNYGELDYSRGKLCEKIARHDSKKIAPLLGFSFEGILIDVHSLQARVRQGCDRSYMDSISPVAKANRLATCTYVHASLTNVTERFYENNNVQNSRSPYGWKKRVGISERRRWPSTFSPDVSEVVSARALLSIVNLLSISKRQLPM